MNKNKENIVGIHSVRILLKVRPFDVYEIYVNNKSSNKFNEILDLSKKNNITIQTMSNEKIYDISSVKSHQGIIAVAKKKDEISESSLVSFLSKISNNQILLIIDDISDPRNFGACLRICDAYNISAVIIVSRTL